MDLLQIEKRIKEASGEYIDEYLAKPLLRSDLEAYFQQNRWYRKIIDRLFRFSSYQRVKRIREDLDGYVAHSNEAYIQRMRHVHADFFQNVEGLALDEQQQRAVITDDNFNLVLAGAGSGKTLTVAAKVKYLVEVKKVDPKRILLMSFTRKAAEEMTERIREKMKIPVTASTFHGLGYRIIHEVERKRPDVITETEVLVQRFFREVAGKDPKLVFKILYFVGLYLDYHEFGDSSYEEMIRHSKLYSLYTFRSQFGRSILVERIEQLKKREERLAAVATRVEGTGAAGADSRPSAGRNSAELNRTAATGHNALKGFETEAVRSAAARQAGLDRNAPDSTIRAEEELRRIRREITRLEQERTTIIGERVKSIEEAKIANFLFLNGIRYQYEAPYPYDIRDNYHKNYRPDFYLPEYSLYWEHFGIDKEGNAPWLSEIEERKYKEGILWKRALHREHGTKLIESYSYQNRKGSFEKNLKAILKEHGIEPKPVDHRKLYRKLFVDGKDRGVENFQALMSTFLNLFKSNGYDRSWFKEVRKKNLTTRDRLFFHIAEKLFAYYESELKAQKKIDFNDMISRATSYVENGKWKCRYQYVIVDEYQDISVARYRLLRGLIRQTQAKLLCVGDDWQSIYRFTGSDLSLFSSFGRYWGRHQLMRIEKTYRNAQQLIDIAGQFVQKNPAQLQKSLLSDRSEKRPVYCIPYKSVKEQKEQDFAEDGGGNGNSNVFSNSTSNVAFAVSGYSNPSEEMRTNLRSPADALYYALEIISKREKKKACRVMLLGRNNADLNMVLESRYYDTEQGISVAEKETRFEKLPEESGDRIRSIDFPKLQMEFLTVHKAKGLQADYVIILNLKNDVTGFPNQISDDPILRYVLSEPEEFEYAEERRLFYVALTRTKKSVFLLSPVLNESPFASEILEDHQLEYQCPDGVKLNKTDLPECPRCRGGKLVVRHSGQSEFLGCSNYPMCSYSISDVSVLENPIRCQCGGYMVRRSGKYGLFLSCSNYPYCDMTLQKLWGSVKGTGPVTPFPNVKESVTSMTSGSRGSDKGTGPVTTFSNVKESVTSTTGGSRQPQSRSTKKSSLDRAVSQKGRSVSQQVLSDEMTKKGKRWTAEEEKILITEYRSQLSIQEIARTHGRSAGAIRSRINKMKEEGRL